MIIVPFIRLNTVQKIDMAYTTYKYDIVKSVCNVKKKQSSIL